MKILGIESASLTASVAVLSGETVIAEYTTNFKKTHSQTLLPMIDEIMQMTDMDVKDLDALAVSAGPGSFTGLRIGAATAKGLAYVIDKPIIPVPTMDAVAYGMYGSPYILCPLTDARRGEAYTGLYEFCGDEFVILQNACALPVTEQIQIAEKFAEERGKEIMYLGDGLPVFKDKIIELSKKTPHFAPAHVCCQRAAGIAVYGEVLYQKGAAVSSFEFDPIYLRKSQAEQDRERAGLSTDPVI